VAEALHHAAFGGRIVLAGVKGFKAVPDFVSDLVVVKEFHIMGAFGVTSPAYRAAIRTIESGRIPVERMHTHDFALEEAEHAIWLLAGEIPGAQSIHSCPAASRQPGESIATAVDAVTASTITEWAVYPCT
jgi:threonine dehydrogenase-like Zn-dependent dehydrogenase